MNDDSEVEFVTFNEAQGIAIDEADGVWIVEDWLDEDGDELEQKPDNWEFVEFVTVRLTDQEVWATIRPDAFEETAFSIN